MIDSEADIDVYFCDFSVPFTAQPSKEKGATFGGLGIFDDAYFSPELGEMVSETSAPRLTVRAEDGDRLVRGDTLQVSKQRFAIVEVQPLADRKTSLLTLAHDD